MKNSLDSKLFFITIYSIRTRSRNRDIVKKLLLISKKNEFFLVVQLLIESSDQIFLEETNAETKEKAIALRENSFSLSNRTKSR